MVESLSVERDQGRRQDAAESVRDIRAEKKPPALRGAGGLVLPSGERQNAKPTPAIGPENEKSSSVLPFSTS